MQETKTIKLPLAVSLTVERAGTSRSGRQLWVARANMLGEPLWTAGDTFYDKTDSAHVVADDLESATEQATRAFTRWLCDVVRTAGRLEISR